MKETADYCSENNRGKIVELNRRIAGHLFVIRKETWTSIREDVRNQTQSKHILGVDTKISNVILASGLTIRLMKEVFIFHYLRMKEGINYTGHLDDYTN